MKFSLIRSTRPNSAIAKFVRQWYELPPKQAPLPHLTYSEYLPGRPWRDEVEGVVVAKENDGKVAVIVLSDETQVLGRYPRAIRPVYGPTVHPAKTFTPVNGYEPFPRVACLDAANATAVGDRVHANRIQGPFFLASGTTKGDGVIHTSAAMPSFRRVGFEIDKIVNVNWETRARTARTGEPIPKPAVQTPPFINRNPTKADAEAKGLTVTRRLAIWKERDADEVVWDGAQVVNRLNSQETGQRSMGEFQESRFSNPSAATKENLRRLVGPDVDVPDDNVQRRLVARRIAVDVAADSDVL